MGWVCAPLNRRGIDLNTTQPLFPLEVPENAMVFPGLLIGRPEEFVKTVAYLLPALEGSPHGRLEHATHFSGHVLHCDRGTRLGAARATGAVARGEGSETLSRDSL